MRTWLRILIAVPVGLVGIVFYLSVRWYFETAKKTTWADVIVAVVIGVIGLWLVGLSDFTLKPVSVPIWLRWTLIAAAGAISITFAILLKWARDDDHLLIVCYAVSMLFGGLAILFSLKEIFG
jgi:multidrug transporter EmrE-like cation transporter